MGWVKLEDLIFAWADVSGVWVLVKYKNPLVGFYAGWGDKESVCFSRFGLTLTIIGSRFAIIIGSAYRWMCVGSDAWGRTFIPSPLYVETFHGTSSPDILTFAYHKTSCPISLQISRKTQVMPHTDYALMQICLCQKTHPSTSNRPDSFDALVVAPLVFFRSRIHRMSEFIRGELVTI